MHNSQAKQIIIKGISGSPGICIGKAYIIDREEVSIIKQYPVSDDLIPKEINRFKQAVEKARKDHAKKIDALKDFSENLNILKAHMALFKDKMLYDKIIDTISSKKTNAEWALREVSRKIKAMFQQIDDKYLQSRANDIAQVSDKIMLYLAGAQDIDISGINERVIIVSHDLTPADASQIQLERVKGFVTDRGGQNSHTSIIAKSLKIPSVSGLGKATSIVKNNDILIVDGYWGTLIINPDEDTIFEYEDRLARFAEYRAELEKESHLPAVTKDGICLNLMANIERVKEVAAIKNYGAIDIGLFRTEFLYLDLKRFPSEDELLCKYKKLVELIAPQSVTIRTLDINGDKVNPHLTAVEEINPSLGLRAVRFCLENEHIFITQLKAIFQAAAFGSINLLIPMVSCIEEIIQVKQVINKAILELESEEKIFNKDIPLGIMIEVPSAVIIAEHLAEHVDFFSIGTNDLIQYSMAIDRNNQQVAHLYQALNPAVLKMIKMTFDAAKKKKIDVIMCGEMAGDPINIPVLIGMGLTDLSMNPGSIPAAKKMIRSLDAKKAKKSVEKIMDLNKVQDISTIILKEYKNIIPFMKT